MGGKPFYAHFTLFFKMSIFLLSYYLNVYVYYNIKSTKKQTLKFKRAVYDIYMLMFFIDIGYWLLGMDTGNLDTDMDKGMDMGKGRLVGCT